MDLKNKTILVTGASSGVGLELVKKLLPLGAQVIGTARASSLPRFKQAGVASDRFFPRELDVASVQSREALYGDVHRAFGGVDVLINNAGINYRAVVEHMDLRAQAEQIEVNYVGPFHLIQLFLPDMRARGRGHVVNVSSVGGMMAMPTMAGYSASKFALEGASESLWYEMKPWNIKVSLVQPGFINSGGFQRVKRTPQSDASEHVEAEPYHQYYEMMGSFIEKMMTGTSATSEGVADVILKTLKRKNPPLRVPATPDAVAFYYLRRLLPRRLYHRILFRNLPEIDKWVQG
jgi:NAD(P)-dependent dehydrogenase (short-subunit alcohol dehydrogenase family)